MRRRGQHPRPITWFREVENLFPVGQRRHHFERLWQFARFVFGQHPPHPSEGGGGDKTQLSWAELATKKEKKGREKAGAGVYPR